MPNWDATLDVKDIWDEAVADKITTAQLSRQISKRLLPLVDKYPEVAYFVDRFRKEAKSISRMEKERGHAIFNLYWTQFYDWADKNRVWIKIH